MSEELFLAVVEKIPLAQARLIITNLNDDELEDIKAYIDVEGDDEVASYLDDAVEAIFGGENRNIIDMTLNGKEYLFAGGTSWGDSPSNEFDYMCALNNTRRFLRVD